MINNTLYVFGIGGTGERVMRSLVMELAGGMQLECRAVQPVLIDSDEKSWALRKTLKLISSYRKIQELLDLDKPYVKDDMVKNNSMFHTRINEPIVLNFSGTDAQSLKALLEPQNFNEDLKAEFDALYSESSQCMDLSWGFVGNPSIGAVVLNQMLKSDEYRNKIGAKIKTNDGVFIISSIFGGTGAAGLPLLVNKIQSDFSGQFDANGDGLKMGALAVFPYFELVDVNTNTNNGGIDQALKDYDVNHTEFSTKTKASLMYYDMHVKALSSMYYLGSGQQAFRSRFKKVKGGEGQNNPACMLEVIGAKAVSHFTANAKSLTTDAAKDNFTNFTDYYEYFNPKVPQQGSCYTLSSIDPDIEFRKVFVRLQFFYYIWRDCAKGWVETSGNQWASSTGMNVTRLDELNANYFNEFFKEYLDWQSELDSVSHRYRFRYFSNDEGDSSEQNTITNRFFPPIDFRKREKGNPVDPGILEKMQSIYNRNTGDAFKNSDEERRKYVFYTSLYAIEHIVNGTNREQCINLNLPQDV